LTAQNLNFRLISKDIYEIEGIGSAQANEKTRFTQNAPTRLGCFANEDAIIGRGF
jgi:hypothetical protein